MPEPEKIRRMAFHLYQTAWAGLDWIYPPLCGGCGKAGEDGAGIVKLTPRKSQKMYVSAVVM